jgi:hypothetical protein
MRPVLLVLSVVVASAAPAVAQKPAARPLVFVRDIEAPAGLRPDAASLTTALCGLIAKDPRVEVLCAPDVKQIMDFAAMGALTGAGTPAVDALERRLAAVTVVVSGSLAQRDADTIALVVSAGPRSAGGDALTPAFGAPAIKVEEAVKGKSSRLLERLPELSARVLKPLLTPTPTSSSTAPPEPLK